MKIMQPTKKWYPATGLFFPKNPHADPKGLTKHSSQRVPSYEPWRMKRSLATTIPWRFWDIPPQKKDKQRACETWNVCFMQLEYFLEQQDWVVAYVFETKTKVPFKLLEQTCLFPKCIWQDIILLFVASYHPKFFSQQNSYHLTFN